MRCRRLLLLLFVPIVAAGVCRPGHEFWDSVLESCVSCTRCKGDKPVVLRPCQVHSDTICGSISSLNIDWSWLDSGKNKNNHHQRRGHGHHKNEFDHKNFQEESHKPHNKSDDDVAVSFVSDEWHEHSKHHKNHHGLLSDRHHHKHHHHHSSSPSPREFLPKTSVLENVHWTTKEAAKLLSHEPRKFHGKHKENLHHHHHHQQNKHNSSVVDVSNTIDAIDQKENSTHVKVHSHHHHNHDRHKTISKHVPNNHKKQNGTHHKHHDQQAKRYHSLPEVASLLMSEFNDSSVLPKSGVSDGVLNHDEKTNFIEQRESHNLHFMSLKTDIDVNKNENQVPRWDVVRPALPPVESAAAIGSAEPFSAAETLVWDGQAIALTLAVFACILFFLVAAIYSIHHARQWRRLKNNFEADVEELSARLGLMAQGSVNEQCESNAAAVSDKQCVFLEQLLVRKQQEMANQENGNVYIEREPATKK